jgi:hypothetical protein
MDGAFFLPYTFDVARSTWHTKTLVASSDDKVRY